MKEIKKKYNWMKGFVIPPCVANHDIALVEFDRLTRVKNHLNKVKK
jgi:hypothetical protein